MLRSVTQDDKLYGALMVLIHREAASHMPYDEYLRAGNQDISFSLFLTLSA